MINSITLDVATPVVSVGSPLYQDYSLVADVLLKLDDGSATDADLAAGAAAQDRIEVALAKAKVQQQEAIVAECATAEVAKTEAQSKAKQAFAVMRDTAAKELATKGEFGVATALRGKGHPAWGRMVLKEFLARFPKGKRSRFHDTVEATLMAIEEVIAKEDEEIAAAQRVRTEAVARQKKNRRDRAA